MHIVKENMKENNSLPTHHPPSLNIHTVNKAKFHIQALQGATCYNILHNAVPGWAGVAWSQFCLGLGGLVVGGIERLLCSHTAAHTFHQFNVVCSHIGMNLRGLCDVINRKVFIKMLTHTAPCFSSGYTQ